MHCFVEDGVYSCVRRKIYHVLTCFLIIPNELYANNLLTHFEFNLPETRGQGRHSPGRLSLQDVLYGCQLSSNSARKTFTKQREVLLVK